MNKRLCTFWCLLLTLIMQGSTAPARAQEIAIPDPGLNAAVREILQKPSGPLTEQDLLSLTYLDAHHRNISTVDGLEAARNLTVLFLNSNLLTNFALPSGLTNLIVLDLSLNQLTNVSLPGGLTNLTTLVIEGNPLPSLLVPPDLTRLAYLDLDNNQLSRFEIPPTLNRLVFVDLGFNALTHFSLPDGLTNLNTLAIAGNSLTSFSAPTGLVALARLDLSQNQLAGIALSADMTNLASLDLFFNQLAEITFPPGLSGLTDLDLGFNHFTSFDVPAYLNHLTDLQLRSNQLTNFSLPLGLTTLARLDLGENQFSSLHLPAGLTGLTGLRISGNTNLASLTLPVGMTNLSGVYLRFNALTNLTLPADLTRLALLDVTGNPLTSLDLPSGLTNLTELFLGGGQLTELTLPPDMTQLNSLVLNGNPLTSLVLSEGLAATNLVELVAALRSESIPVFTYPLTIQLVRKEQPIGAFRFGITGPPGDYTILSSADLASWSVLGTAANPLGSVFFTDVGAHLAEQRFYRALRQTPPANMVFIPPNTFTMGSPTNEQDRSVNEGPQTTVTLTRGFWIGRYEVTQGEYLSVMNTNPSEFPGDLSRPISSVSWFDATNYCAKLTEREFAAGRIAPGTRFRLPTEAEWECAARAGTSTRFSYGDDPGYDSVTNYMWEFFTADLTVHPVGQKVPNEWGVYDMQGNVWEWCQDWYDSLPGGVQTDPTGPAGPVQFSSKVIRGGAYDYPNSSCRSASRLFSTPFHTDTDIGIRVVLASDP
jgi:formylglycine-generating enzyme required for sulfatase activity